MIKLTNTAVLGVLERFGGEVFSFRWERDGKIGRKQWLYFGETEHFLDVPQPGEYWLKVFPSRYIFNFSIEVYEMILDTDLTALALKTGLNESFLKLQSSQVIQLLEGIDKMPSADTRNLANALNTLSTTVESNKTEQEALNTATAQSIQAAQTTADGAVVSVGEVNQNAQELMAETVINEQFDVVSADFTVQSSGVYQAFVTLTKIDGSKGVQTSLTDASGDEQGFSQLMAKYQGNVQKCAVELTATQYADSEYPMSLVCQGQRLMSAPTVSGTPIGNGATVSLADYVMTVKDASGAVINTITDVYQGWFTRGTVFIQFANGTFRKLDTPWTQSVVSTIEEWDSANGGVIL